MYAPAITCNYRLTPANRQQHIHEMNIPKIPIDLWIFVMPRNTSSNTSASKGVVQSRR